MIVAYDGKSDDTADGQEQPHAGSSPAPREEDRAGLDRWADDGASGRSPATVLWNLVRRLKETGGLILREPVTRKVENKSKSAPAIDAPRRTPNKRSAQSAAAAKDAYYRNAWENT